MARSSRESFGVLVADDDAGCRYSLTQLLALEGFRTLSVEGGEQALARIARLRFTNPEVLGGDSKSAQSVLDPVRGEGLEEEGKAAEVVERGTIIEPRIHFLVLDYNMPDLSGLEVLRRVRDELHLILPAIVVSGEFSRELEVAVRQVGGFGLLPKPVKPRQLRDLVRELIRSHFA